MVEVHREAEQAAEMETTELRSQRRLELVAPAKERSLTRKEVAERKIFGRAGNRCKSREIKAPSAKQKTTETRIHTDGF